MVINYGPLINEEYNKNLPLPANHLIEGIVALVGNKTNNAAVNEEAENLFSFKEEESGLKEAWHDIIFTSKKFNNLSFNAKKLMIYAAIKVIESSQGNIISINIEEYANLFKGVYFTHAAKNRKKELNQLKEIRKQLKKSCDELIELKVSGEVEIKNVYYAFNSTIFTNSSMTVDGYKGVFSIELNEKIANLFRKSAISYINDRFFSLDGRKPHAMTLGFKLSLNYYSKANRNNKKAPLKYKTLKVSSILAYMNLPSYEASKERKGWRISIKEQFENALDSLYREGIVTDWCYSKKHGEPLSEEEANFATFEEWKNTNLFYEMKENEND